MQVALVTGFGPPEVLVTRAVADPTAGPGEVVIDVTAADVLWVDTRIREGAAQEFFDVRPPYVPGNAVAGHVGAVGGGVDAAWLGQPVVAHTGGEWGGYAERVAVPVGDVSLVPAGLGLVDAAALLHDGPTALALFEGLRVTAGDSLLVVGASGGLGIVSLQLARVFGARAVAVARDAGKLARIREMDVDAVVDGDHPAWLDQARTALGGAGADVILDNVGGRVGEAAFGLVAPGGRFSAHGTPSGRFAAVDPAEAQCLGVTVHGIKEVQLSREHHKRLTEQALAEAAAGRLRPVVGQTFPLTRAAQAHAAIAGRAVFGKTLLRTAAA